MKKIGFDFDGVIIELPEDYRKLSAILKDETGFSNLIKEVMNSDVWREYLYRAKPIKGIGKLRQLCRKEDIYVISRRLESDRKLIEYWLQKHKIPIPSEKIFLRKDLSISPVEFKKSKVVELNLDKYLDDDEDIVVKIPNAKKFTGWKNIKFN